MSLDERPTMILCRAVSTTNRSEVMSQKRRSSTASSKLTSRDSPGRSVTFSKPRSCRSGCLTRDSCWWVYSWTTSLPVRFPVLVTQTVTVTVSPGAADACEMSSVE
jgi:hypothetical protein